MNKIQRLRDLAIAIVIVLTWGSVSAEAQFAIPWFTIDGGGGMSAGAGFEVFGTIGQHDSSFAMTGGDFSLTGGFWTSVQDDAVLLGDVNMDGIVNLLDVQPFVDAVSNGMFIAEADINQDGVVNLLDVDGFVSILSGA